MADAGSFLEIKLNRLDRVYRPNEKVEGFVVVNAKKGWSHSGINMIVEGLVYVSAANRGFVGIGGDLNNRPTHILRVEKNVAPSGKFPDGATDVPFEFTVTPLPGETLLESYHGVHISVVYNIQVTCDRGVMKKALSKDMEFLIEIPSADIPSDPEPVHFEINPEVLSNINTKNLTTVPKFSISGKLHRTKCLITQPLTGEVVVELSAVPVKSLELQLVRVESIMNNGKLHKEATEVQNIQIGEGNICRNLSVPMYMVFPRIFSCPTVSTNNFKIEFEVNLIMVYGDGLLVTENFPITIYRDLPK